MAEYIDRNLIEWYGCDFENADCENRECSGCSHANCSHSQVMQIPTVDVIERAEHDKLHNLYLKAIHNHTECVKEIHEYRSKIDKAIEEMESYEEEVYHRDTEKKEYACVYHCLEILKRNIGE